MKTVLLSYPRSGNTWLRYCIEHITVKSTIGYDNEESAIFDRSRLVSHYVQTEPILIKRHFPEPCDRLILLVRDYKEAIIRHENEAERPSSDHVLYSGISHYIQLLDFYDKFEGEKLLIYYEDLIKNPREIIEGALVFLKETTHRQRVNEFFDFLQYHKNTCVNIYSTHATSYTRGEQEKFHSRFLSARKKQKWDEIAKNNNIEIFNKYLSRYAE